LVVANAINFFASRDPIFFQNHGGFSNYSLVHFVSSTSGGFEELGGTAFSRIKTVALARGTGPRP
jgi:hypothetical protein